MKSARSHVAAIAALTLGFTALGSPAAQAADPVAIDIISINDFHGRLEAAPPIAGAAVMGGMIDAYRAANPNTAFVGAGDLIGASTFASFIQNDQPTIDALNAMQLDASALGNHEFDQGRTDVDDRIVPAADWDYLSANIYDRDTGQPAYPEYSLKQFGEVTVGFVGATTEELPSLVSPDGIASLEVRPVVPEINRVAAALGDGDDANGEADVVVLLVHEGAATGASADIDAIISAHTHLAYDHEIPIASSGVLRPVVSSGQYGERYSDMKLSVDPETGALLSISAEVLPLAGAFPPDPEIAEIVADAVAVAVELGSVPVGTITADLNRALQSSGAENRGGESPLGNFVADVQLWATRDAGAQIALMNPGGLRSDLRFAANPLTPGDGEGVVTYQEAAGVQPFANTLVAMDLTGTQLTAVLEEQWQPASAARPFLKLGLSESLTYSYDPLGLAGDRIDVVYLDGEPIDETATYRVAVNSFLASGGDNFPTLALGTNRADTGKIDLQSMVDYFEANPVATPDYAQRSVGVSLSAPAADGGYAPGESVTLALSSLLFSNGEPNAGEVVVSADGVELGRSVIDPTIVDTTDEVGRATVQVTVPESAAPGPLPLTVEVPQTGTSIEVPIEVVAVEPPAEPQSTITVGHLSRLLASTNSTVTYSVAVWADEGVPTGDVGIYDGHRRIATATLDEAGRATVTLPKLGRGLHLISSRYEGSEFFSASASWPNLLIVLPAW
jgi:5'-nucleotidase